MPKGHSLWDPRGLAKPRERGDGKPTKGAGEIWLPGEVIAPQLEAAFAPPLAGEPATATGLVRFSDVDQARHLNNASAVEMLDNAAWNACLSAAITPDTASFTPLSYDIEYVDSPRFAEELVIQTWHDPFPLVGREFRRTQ